MLLLDVKVPEIYAVCVDRIERYIGKSLDRHARLGQHLSIARRGAKNRLSKLLRAAIRDGKEITVIWVDEVRVPEEWPAVEAAYIQFYRESGFDLVNGTFGGDGAGAGEDHPLYGLKGEQHPAYGNKHSPETIDAMRTSRKGIRKTDEHKEALRTSLTGVKHTPERRAANSASKVGIPLSEKQCIALTGVKRKGSSSQFHGVSWSKASSKWFACLCIKGRTVRIGYFHDETEAAKAVDAFVRANNLSSRLLNFA